MSRGRTLLLGVLVLALAAGTLLVPTVTRAAVNCNNTTIGPINFGNVDPITAGTQMIGAMLTVSCTSNDSKSLLDLAAVSSNNVDIHFNAQNGAAGVSGNNRKIVDSSHHFLPVQVYQDSSASRVWGGAGSHWATDAFTPPTFSFTSNYTSQSPFAFSAKLFGPFSSARAGSYSQTFIVNIDGSYMRCTGLSLLGICLGRSPTSITGNFTFTVQAHIEKVCHASFKEGTPIPTLNFGSASFLSAPETAATSFQITCTNGTAYQVGLDNGQHFTGGTRRMTDGSHYISYQLYKDAARSHPWGAIGSNPLSANGTGQPQSITIYGRVPAQSPEPAGSYEDTVQVRVTY